MTGEGRADTLQVRLLAVPAAASLVRERLRRWLDVWAWPDHDLDDVVLAVHEAVTNSIEHGYGGLDAGDVEVVGTRLCDGAHQRVRFTVRDSGRWRPPREPGFRGRGLPVMQGCMDEVEIRPGQAGTEVEMLSRPVPIGRSRTPAPMTMATTEVRTLVSSEADPLDDPDARPVGITGVRTWLLDHIGRDGRRLSHAARAGLDAPVPTCPDWTGADLLAHLCGYARFLDGLFAGTRTLAGPVPVVDPADAARDWDDDLDRMLALLRDTPDDAAVPNWSVQPDTAGWWVRRTAQDLAIHRYDGDLFTTPTPDPIPADLARDGIAEYAEVFVATGLAVGMVPTVDATLVLELTDSAERQEHHLPRPGPATVVRGTASDLLLALWHRRDLLEHHVSGDRTILEQWPRI